MRRVSIMAVAIAAAVAWAGVSQAATSTILGKKLLVKDPKTGSDDTKRKVLGLMKEKPCGDLLPGDPRTSGAVLQFFGNTDTGPNGSQNECYDLDASGWSRIPANEAKDVKGYRYKNKDDTVNGVGANPVKIVLIKQIGDLCFFKALLKGKDGQVDMVPPGDVTFGGLSFETNDTGNQWCAGFGVDTDGGNDPDPEGTTRQKSKGGVPQLLLMKNPVNEGCPAPGGVCGSASGAFIGLE